MPATGARRDAPWPEAEHFAAAWARRIVGTSYVPLLDAEINDLLYRLAVQLGTALLAEPFTSRPGYDIGVELVAADFSAPEALGRTVSLVNSGLLHLLGLPEEPYRARVEELVESVATGYARAIRDRTLAEQDAIRRAAMAARATAEAALRDSEAQRQFAVLYDPLTGLPNRAMFMERLASRLAPGSRGGRLAVCALNIDRFDVINDSLGQEVGDKILTAVAHRIAELARQRGYLLARLGGDEFGLLVERTAGSDDVTSIAESFLAVVARPVNVDGHEVTLTASMGIVEQQATRTNTTELTRAARMSLHWAKIDGRARWVLFDPVRGARQVERSALSAQMPAALARGEFGLVYQPLVSLIDGDTHGVEALARWQHPTMGLIGPDRFIDLAEDTGLIVALGIRLLDEACRQAAEWHRLSPKAPFVSVNLAVRQLRHPGLLREVMAVLDSTGLPADRLQLEITESAVLSTDDETLGTLHALADLGIRLAIDAFATG